MSRVLLFLDDVKSIILSVISMWTLISLESYRNIICRMLRIFLCFLYVHAFVITQQQKWIQNKYTKLDFLVVLCGRGTWSVILRERNRLRMFKNRVLRNLRGPRKDVVTAGLPWYILLAKYYSCDRIRRMKWAEYVARSGGERCVHGFGGETWGKERTWKTWEWMGR
jgi:hypothetical protein